MCDGAGEGLLVLIDKSSYDHIADLLAVILKVYSHLLQVFGLGRLEGLCHHAHVGHTYVEVLDGHDDFECAVKVGCGACDEFVSLVDGDAGSWEWLGYSLLVDYALHDDVGVVGRGHGGGDGCLDGGESRWRCCERGSETQSCYGGASFGFVDSMGHCRWGINKESSADVDASAENS